MVKIKVKHICIAGVMAAMSFGLDMLSVTTNESKITLYSLPLLMSGIFFGPYVGLLTGLVAGFLSQLVGPYGLSATAPLWMLAPMAWGFFSGLIFQGFEKKEKKNFGLVITIGLTSIITLLLNTLAMWLDGIIFKYPTAYIWTNLFIRFVTSIGFAALYSVFIVLVYDRLKVVLTNEKKAKQVNETPENSDLDEKK